MARPLRPEILNPLFAGLEKLPGLGPRTAPLMAKLIGGWHVADLLWHLPSAIIDRRFSPPITPANAGRLITTELTIIRHEAPSDRRRPYRIVCTTPDQIELTLIFFHARDTYLHRHYPEGEDRIVSGKLEFYRNQAQITHPDRSAPLKDRALVQTVEPVYPMTKGITAPALAKSMARALELTPELPEWIDGPLKKREGWADFKTALACVHKPEQDTDLDPASPARCRLAYDELLSQQLALGLVRLKMRALGGRRVIGDNRLRTALRAALPFTLTGAQERAIAEIDRDMASPGRMLRLLQGDVGSGKTIVALMTLLSAVEAGFQGALMAPTEILALQHYENLSRLLTPLGVRVVCLTGRTKGKAREEILSLLAGGEAQIAIGTHALFQDSVIYADLAAAVIDEQHRFGVQQRITLTAKGKGVDVLVMTATPIPRTLSLTAFGDMEVSRLDEKPPGRKPIDTRVLPIDRLDEVIAGLARKRAQDAQIYWVCPLIGESEMIDLAAAEDRYRHLTHVLGGRIGLVHGKMKAADKEAVMAQFISGDLKILVATTVIEVGVDVPNATVMVIEHAERFGLAQLHQLRGRVGRGSAQSSCLLLYTPPLGETARARLEALRGSEDGFYLAEQDLALRGGGDVLGTRQSGLTSYRMVDLAVQKDLAEWARSQSKVVLETNPDLSGDHGEALRILLYLFERDAAVRFFRSG